MSWQIALCILISINIGGLVLNKVATNKVPKKGVGIFFQYLFCALIAILYALFSGKADINFMIILIGAVGFVNAFGCYFQWRAFDLSLSKSVLFFPLMQIVTIGLALIFLKEGSLWNLQLIFGAGLCFLSMWLFRSMATGKEGEKAIPKKKWLFFTLGMVIIFGVCSFLMKVFSYSVPRETFLMGWYSGALLGSLPLLAIEKQNPIKISKKAILIIFPLSLLIMGALFALYWAYQLGGPISMVQPIQGVAITIIPALLGWFIFKEKSGLSKREKWGFLIGIIGAILILLR